MARPLIKNWCQLEKLTSTKPQSPIGDSTLANLSQWLLDRGLGTPPGKTRPQRGVAHFVRVIYALSGSIQPWMATVACEKFYEVDSLAAATRISHNYQVLLDDGNRIIIPRGNFKIFTTTAFQNGQPATFSRLHCS